MEENKYVGNALAITYLLDEELAKLKGFTSSHILLLIKYGIHPSTQEDINLTTYLENCFDRKKEILLRIGSECMFGVYGDSHCDCEEQRLNSLECINLSGQGIYIHLPQEAQGRGLFYKTQELELQVSGRNIKGEYVGEKSIEEAYKYILGPDATLDIRDYSCLHEIFTELHLLSYDYTLLTSSQQKADQLMKVTGIKINAIKDVHRHMTIHNITEFLGKLYQKNAFVTDTELDRMHEIVNAAPIVPMRLINIINFIREDIVNGTALNTNITKLDELVELVMAKSPKETQERIHDSLPIKNLAGDTEYEYSFKVTDSIFDQLYDIFGKNYINYTSYEVSRHYDTVGSEIMDNSGRQLKIRTSYNLYGMKENIATRMIYKTRLSNSTYKTINKELAGEIDIELMNANPLYKQTKEQDVITHVCELTPEANLLVKLYPGTGRFLELKGKKQVVDEFAKRLRLNNKLTEEDISLILKSVGLVNKFPEESRQRLLRSEKELGKKYNISNKQPRFAIKFFH